MSTVPILETQGLCLSVGERTLLNDCDWQVYAGQCWCVLGGNGAGKSSLLRSLAGLRDVQAGQIRLWQKNLTEWRLDELARQRSFLPQHRVDAFSYPAIDTVLSARHPYHESHYWDSEQDYEIALSAMAQLDVAHLAQRDVRSLSGGERQRVAIAALIAQDTDLMLLDEPANALDLAHQVSVMAMLSKACQARARTVIVVSHDLNLSYRVATHVLLMMPDGSYLSGEKAAIMTEENLSACLSHPIQSLSYQDQILFVPQ